MIVKNTHATPPYKRVDPIHNTEMIKIASLEIRTALVPLLEPHRTASGVLAASPLVLLSVKTDQGTEGHSLAFDEDAVRKYTV